MRIELEVACRLARYCCDVMNSSHGGIPLQTRNRLSLKMAVAAPIATTQGQHKFLLRLSCWPPFEPRNPAEVDRSQRLPVSPLWVKSRHHKGSAECPLTPESGHRTFASGLAALMFVDRGLDRRLRLRA